MPGAARAKQDIAVGTITSGSDDVLINNQPAARKGDPIQPHAPFPPAVTSPPHQSSTIVEGSSSVVVNNIPLAYKGHQTSCNHPITTGSDDVEVGG